MADSQAGDWNGGYSGARIRRKIPVTDAVVMVDAITAGLIAAGWEDRGAIAARATLVFPFGAPTTTLPTDPGPYTPYTQQSHRIQDDVILWYDPYRGSTDGRANTIWVPMGLTSEAGMLALVSAIDGGTDWHVINRYTLTSGAQVVEVEANTTGSAWNTVGAGGVGSISGIGFWGGGSFGDLPHDGGGYRVRAWNAYGWLEAAITVSGAGAVHIEFSCSEGGATPYADLVAEGYGGFGATDLTLVANQFQFFLWTHGTDVFGGTLNAVMATLPYIEPDRGCTYAAIVARAFRQAMQWQQGSEWTAVNGGFELPGSYHGRAPGLHMIYHLSTLTDAVGMAVGEPAFIGAPVTGSSRTTHAGHARIVGRLWDAYIAHRQGSGFSRDDRTTGPGNLRYQCVANNTAAYWSPGSLWIAYGSADEPEQDF
jgi:hypothetical protein